MWVENVFNLSKMQASFFKGVFKLIKNIIIIGEKLDFFVVDVVVIVMWDWVMGKGVMYYVYVFYFMINFLVEKYDGFIFVQGDGNVILEFFGKVLV